jgi:hypothetical protein
MALLDLKRSRKAGFFSSWSSCLLVGAFFSPLLFSLTKYMDSSRPFFACLPENGRPPERQYHGSKGTTVTSYSSFLFSFFVLFLCSLSLSLSLSSFSLFTFCSLPPSSLSHSHYQHSIPLSLYPSIPLSPSLSCSLSPSLSPLARSQQNLFFIKNTKPPRIDKSNNNTYSLYYPTMKLTFANNIPLLVLAAITFSFMASMAVTDAAPVQASAPDPKSASDDDSSQQSSGQVACPKNWIPWWGRRYACQHWTSSCSI